ncbi:MAG: hypothetical protein ABIB12_02095 [Patescibacteria group bacterium]
MNQDFSELVQYLDTKFGKTDQALATLQEDVIEIKREVSDLKETVHELVTAIDKLAKAVDDLRIEYSAMALQLNRHEKWIQQLAEKLGLKLDY